MDDDEFEYEPRYLIPRIDGGTTAVYQSRFNPDKVKVYWDGAPDTWTQHFQNMMDAGEVKKH